MLRSLSVQDATFFFVSSCENDGIDKNEIDTGLR